MSPIGKCGCDKFCWVRTKSIGSYYQLHTLPKPPGFNIDCGNAFISSVVLHLPSYIYVTIDGFTGDHFNTTVPAQDLSVSIDLVNGLQIAPMQGLYGGRSCGSVNGFPDGPTGPEGAIIKTGLGYNQGTCFFENYFDGSVGFDPFGLLCQDNATPAGTTVSRSGITDWSQYEVTGVREGIIIPAYNSMSLDSIKWGDHVRILAGCDSTRGYIDPANPLITTLSVGTGFSKAPCNSVVQAVGFGEKAMVEIYGAEYCQSLSPIASCSDFRIERTVSRPCGQHHLFSLDAPNFGQTRKVAVHPCHQCGKCLPAYCYPTQ